MLVVGVGIGIFVMFMIDELTRNNRGVSLNGTPIQIPPRLFDKPTENELYISVRFPKEASGILMFAKNPKGDFQIIYVKDGAVITNTNNDPNKSLVLFGKSEQTYWRRFYVSLSDSLKTSPVYIGNAPSILPENLIAFPGTNLPEPFPRNGLLGCIKIIVNGKTELTDYFLKHKLKECWGF
jgi:hypothetical protein